MIFVITLFLYNELIYLTNWTDLTCDMKNLLMIFHQDAVVVALLNLRGKSLSCANVCNHNAYPQKVFDIHGSTIIQKILRQKSNFLKAKVKGKYSYYRRLLSEFCRLIGNVKW